MSWSDIDERFILIFGGKIYGMIMCIDKENLEKSFLNQSNESVKKIESSRQTQQRVQYGSFYFPTDFVGDGNDKDNAVDRKLKYKPEDIEEIDEDEGEGHNKDEDKKEDNMQKWIDSIAINQETPLVRDMDCEQKEKLENEFRMDRGHIMV